MEEEYAEDREEEEEEEETGGRRKKRKRTLIMRSRRRSNTVAGAPVAHIEVCLIKRCNGCLIQILFYEQCRINIETFSAIRVLQII